MSSPFRVLVFVSASAAIFFGGVRLHLVTQRLDALERTPRADPHDLARVKREIERVQEQVALSLDELRELRTTEARTVKIDRRLETVESALTAAACSLADQHEKIELWEKMKDEIGPRALDERIELFRRGVQDQWKEIDSLANAALRKAEAAELDLAHVEQGLARDKDRMWHELLGPVVQLMGNETVGSGVLLRSERIADTDEYRTYLLTAWHVIRDIQAGPDNVHVPVPVTIYGADHRVQPETAELLKFDAGIDSALLVLTTTRPIECGALLPPRHRLEDVQIFEQVYAVGCPLGNDPIPTFGEIADTAHIVDGAHYWMISAPTYIGNSGGGIFDAQSHELLGIFSKIYTHGTLRPTVVPHMGLVTPLETIYDWLDNVGYASIPESAEAARTQTAAAKR
ncbi:MAG: trypsin-like peptidase domain-containing protein [Planctomycetota bacterium]